MNVDRGPEQRLVVVIVSFLVSGSRSRSWHGSSDKLYWIHSLHRQLKYKQDFSCDTLLQKYFLVLPVHFVVKLVEDWRVPGLVM